MTLFSLPSVDDSRILRFKPFLANKRNRSIKGAESICDTENSRNWVGSEVSGSDSSIERIGVIPLPHAINALHEEAIFLSRVKLPIAGLIITGIPGLR